MAILISIANLLAALHSPRPTRQEGIREDELMPYRTGDTSLIIPDEL